MLITRTPLRISFLGGGSDLPAFYNQAVGRVISTAINRYVFIVFNEKFDGRFRVGYSVTEIVDEPHRIKNTRVRAALQFFKVKKGLEIVSVADVPSYGTGLGSSSSFAVGLVNGLSQFFDYHYHRDRQQLAEAACHLEIDLLGEPIGKQDQYAAAFGGLNVMEFHPDRVVVQPVKLSRDRLVDFQTYLLVFDTGIRRNGSRNSRLLTKNLSQDEKKFVAQQQLVQWVTPFKNKLVKGDFQGLGELLNEGWQLKKKLSPAISNGAVDALYRAGLRNGAWGGKLLGAGGGGFILFIAPPKNHDRIIRAFRRLRQLPVGFDTEGSKVIFNRYEYT